VSGESAARRELGAAASMEEGARVWVGRERGRPGADKGVGEDDRGTGREDGRHVARLTRMAGGGDACRGAREKTEKEREGADRWGPAEDFIFFFLFFFPGL
jgi:hypothetical protein